MNNSCLSSKTLLLLLFFINATFLSFKTVKALVPSSKTFKYALGSLSGSENDASNLLIPQIANHPFMLGFYPTTPNAYILGLLMGYRLQEDAFPPALKRRVWSANLNRPVSRNATLTFGLDGNLVLAEAGGRIVWQTRTVNKGVVDLKLLSNGNLVLLNRNGGFVWQTFDYPTDTLLNGQALRGDGSNKLVSGSYSMVVDVIVRRQFLTLFFNSKKKNSTERQMLSYHIIDSFGASFKNVTFYVTPVDYSVGGRDFGNQIGLSFLGDPGDRIAWGQTKYNSTLSILQLTRDGNVRVYTYNEKGLYGSEWEETYTYFSLNECSLPEKCGVFGLCSKRQCIACPTSKGLMGWSQKCKPEKLPPCTNTTSSSARLVDYYKIKGMSSSLRRDRRDATDFVEMKIGDCRNKCSADCKCVGFFYRTTEGRCLLANFELYTLTTDPEWDQVQEDYFPIDGYIKFAK
ncbi:hypothetical protein C5167_037972 [Papaver somniferum]|uniref:Bulb-type lectin domain-containing protein n=1 Tax=Papaver somniferum TaxID=3469 RepID=A0A4Y7I7V5_PAPSO|nr:epidermis-specific secreted glycoprotein EP1-like [Papaver somniferum]RZC45013.1 hypothetical protein C5167_037972 [Papaver somniferum]